jgi:hypothetical protein
MRLESQTVNDSPKCSKRCAFEGMKALHGPNSPAWQGGKGTVNTLGYIVRSVRKKTILEHRAVMEAHLGRQLNKGEVVHHINGIKTDNRIENLMVCQTQSAHVSGHHKKGTQRTTCHLCGAKERARGLCNAHYKLAKRHGLLPATPEVKLDPQALIELCNLLRLIELKRRGSMADRLHSKS